jgi:membrane protein DedA with SNARE-associated domain
MPPFPHRRPPSFIALSFSAAGLLCAVAGAIGYNLSRHSRFVEGTAWRSSVIWWEVLTGLALLVASVFWWRRAFQSWRRYGKS